MANGNVWPSALGGGFARGMRTIYDAVQSKRALERKDRELDIQERRTDLDAQAQALQSALSIIPFLPRDKPISEMGELHELFSTAFPGVDFSDPMMSQTVFNERTINTVFNTLVTERLDELSGTPEGRRAIERMINRLSAGVGAPSDVLEATEQAQISDAELVAQSWEWIKDDPEVMADVFRVSKGLDPIIDFQVGDEIYSFDSRVGASLTADLLKHFSLLNFRFEELSRSEQKDIVEELMNQAASLNIQVGRAQASRIISALYEQSRGDYEGTEGPWYELQDEFSQRPDGEELLRVMGIAGGAMREGFKSIEQWLMESPEGQQTMIFGYLSNMISDAFPNADETTLKQLTSNIVQHLAPRTGVSFGTGGLGFLPFLADYKIRFDLPNQIGAERHNPGGPGPIAPDAARISPSLGNVTPKTEFSTEPDLEMKANEFRSDAELYYSGEITLNDLKRKYHPLAVKKILENRPRKR